LNATRIGKLIMSACFVTDMATAIALSAIFIKPNAWFPVYLVGSIALIVALPKIAPWFFRRYGDRVIEPEIKLIFVCLFVLMVIADAANGHAVLPAFILGLVMAKHYQEHRDEQQRLRVVVIRLPHSVLLPPRRPKRLARCGVRESRAPRGAFGAKRVPKVSLILPLARRYVPRHATFTTLLMSTGLTFGTISSLYGLNAGIIDQTQFSLLVTVVVLSAIVPTAIAERWFLPDSATERHEDVRHPPLPAEEYV
jgi:Kef-type K+ transport system membrane component KefB